VFSWAWHSTPERESQVTISLKPDGAGTMLTLHHEQFFDQAAATGMKKAGSHCSASWKHLPAEPPDSGAAHATAQYRFTRRMDCRAQTHLAHEKELTQAANV